jgi:hydroxymethylbilane synthase
MMAKIRLATRGSQLARYQAQQVGELLGLSFHLVIVRTSGDRFFDSQLAEGTTVGFFTREIEQALLAGRADLAVHSLKDLPVQSPPGLMLSAFLKRDEADDLLLVRPEAFAPDLALPLKPGSRVGASSQRRQALLAYYRRDLQAVPLRGNVPTRMEKVRRGEVDAAIISRAGPARLKLPVEQLLAFDLNPEQWIGAAGQGVIAVQARAGEELAELARGRLDHPPTRESAECERALLKLFGGGCHAPFGCRVLQQEDSWRILLCALTAGRELRLGDFRAPTLVEVRQQASQWLQAGCPLQPREPVSWLTRPARRWC